MRRDRSDHLARCAPALAALVALVGCGPAEEPEMTYEDYCDVVAGAAVRQAAATVVPDGVRVTWTSDEPWAMGGELDRVHRRAVGESSWELVAEVELPAGAPLAWVDDDVPDVPVEYGITHVPPGCPVAPDLADRADGELVGDAVVTPSPAPDGIVEPLRTRAETCRDLRPTDVTATVEGDRVVVRWRDGPYGGVGVTYAVHHRPTADDPWSLRTSHEVPPGTEGLERTEVLRGLPTTAGTFGVSGDKDGWCAEPVVVPAD